MARDEQETLGRRPDLYQNFKIWDSNYEILPDAPQRILQLMTEGLESIEWKLILRADPGRMTPDQVVARSQQRRKAAVAGTI